jgi:hypothetical protein
MEEDAKYAERKQKKLAIYDQNEFPLIQLTNADIDNLDDTLPPKLLKHKIKVG